ncbi:MAG: myxosortase-dependent metalloprotease, MXAN_2677/MXAN_2678 family [Myxococcaceae bacterium]
MIGAATAVVLTALSASTGYVRSRAVPTAGTVDPYAHCLWWKNGTQITYSPQKAGNPETTGSTELDAIDAAFATWQAVLQDCSDVRFFKGPLIDSRLIGFDPARSDNTNSIIFRTRSCRQPGVVPVGDACDAEDTCQNKYDCWEYATGVIALTTTTFDRSGVVYDSDIELNARNFIFTTVSPPTAKCPMSGPFNQDCIATDVQNVMTHEIGHLLGLDHSREEFCRTGGSLAFCPPTQVIKSTMTDSAETGETYKREIDPGSKEFICTVYPKGQVSRDCVTDAINSLTRGLDGGSQGPYECCALGAKSGCQATDGLLMGFTGVLSMLSWRRRGMGSRA